MTNEPSEPTPSAFAEEYKQRLLLRAKAGRPLSVDDVVAVMPRVELTPDLLAEIRQFMLDNHIPFDDEPVDASEFDDVGIRRSRRRQDPARVAAAALSRASSSADPVRMYLKEIGKVPLLTADEEVELAKRIEVGAIAVAEIAELNEVGEWSGQSGERQRSLRRAVADGERARSELTSANLRLVVS
ncbi:MAG: sigma-70 factor domain-containing protein, partial [Actinomycetota bacterium]